MQQSLTNELYIESISGCVRIACSGLMITGLLHSSWLSRLFINKLNASCFNNLQHTVNSKVILTPSKESFSWPQDDPFKRVILTSFGLTPVKTHFNPLNRVILTTQGVISMQINSSEVSFYTDLESFRLLFGIEVSF